MKNYEIGDKIKIKDKTWYDKNCDELGRIDCGNLTFVPKMNKFLDLVATIKEITLNRNGRYYKLDIDGGKWSWTEEMFVHYCDSNYTLIPFGEVFIAVDKVNNTSIPEFFNSEEDFSNYVKNRR